MTGSIHKPLRSPSRSLGLWDMARCQRALPWLVLGILAWPDLAGLAARDEPPQRTRPSATPASAPPPSAAPQAPPVQPDPLVLPPMLAQVEGTPRIASPRFQFKIAADTPLRDLLPVPPRPRASVGAGRRGDLSQVPEIELQMPVVRGATSGETLKQTAHLIARVNHLNGKKTDAFLEALRDTRPDLAGMPFAMGEACRTTGKQNGHFARAVATIRAAIGPRPGQVFTEVLQTQLAPAPIPPAGPAPDAPPTAPQAVAPPQTGLISSTQAININTVGSLEPPDPDSFWDRYQAACNQEDRTLARAGRGERDCIVAARIAALMQVLAPESPGHRLGLVKYLCTLSHVEATRALARLAIFASENDVRQAAIDGLRVRRERDCTDILVAGLRYPWPDVAARAGEALVKLERSDLVPQLIAVLEEPDPRAPVERSKEGRLVPVARELVRINHHRNCLLCHAPGNTGNVAPETLTAAVPVPDEPLPSPSEGYRITSPDVLIRVDVTYLRQDFSMLQPVADAHPWPEMQRFDFLVRSRELTEAEAEAYRREFTPTEPGRLSPYHRTALAALRELTGKDTEPTAEAWRRLLKLPARRQEETVIW